MGKRSDFPRRERDFYPTPFAPVVKLRPWLDVGVGRGFTFCEPCAGEGDLIRHLEAINGRCVWRSDLPLDARNIAPFQTIGADYIITNPPWPSPNGRGEPTISIIAACMKLKMSWFLLSADFAHNGYFRPLERHCRRIVSVGRVKWIEDSDHAGKDNAAWYLFSERHTDGPRFHNAE